MPENFYAITKRFPGTIIGISAILEIIKEIAIFVEVANSICSPF
jgi:hypothetical protein